jgi:hypothetical protein
MSETKYPPYVKPTTGGNTTTGGGGKSKGSIIDTLVYWMWLVFSIIPSIVINSARLMVTPGTVAAGTIGGFIMITGMLMSADSYWQLWSQQPALFHFFEKTWLGWGWVPHPIISLSPPKFAIYPGLLFNGNFLFAICLSSTVQVIQSVSFRPGKFKGASIAGISPQTIGFIAWGFWAFDILMAFGSRNPFMYTSVSDRLWCATYDVISVFTAELGFMVFMMLKESKY